MPRSIFLIGVSLALVAGSLALTHELLAPWPGVNERNVGRIREGMLLREVEAIFGSRGRWYFRDGNLRYAESMYVWQGIGGRAFVLFGERHGQPTGVASAVFYPVTGAPSPLRSWLSRRAP